MSFQDIQAAIDLAVRANGGRAFINANTIARHESAGSGLRGAMEALAVACGARDTIAADLTPEQLAMLYAVARKDMAKAQHIAQDLNDTPRVPNDKGAFDPILEDAPPVTAPPVTAPPVPSQFDLEAILEVARKEASAMAEYVASDRLSGLIDTLAAIHEGIDAKVASAIAALAPTSLTVTLPDTSSVELGTVHYMQERLIRVLGAGCNVYLYGPAGSGKTTAGRKCADAFKLPFYFTGKIDSEYLLLGFLTATGETVRTQFREAYERGGVFLFDEIDRSAPSAFTALNAALANGICAFPDGVIQMHPDFKCIAAGNTRMGGADNTYTAGQQQDASSIDRFAFIHWGYDEKLELALASDKAWARLVQAVRAQCEARGINHLITPRATLDGCKLLAVGDTWEDAASAVLWKGLDASTVATLTDATRDMWGLI
jgi:cobaltochelatase CobS